MEKKFAEIINEGKKNGKTVEEINAALKVAGATFHLSSLEGNGGWTEAEMTEGFIPGAPAEDAQRTLDMSRKMEFAGTKQIQWIPGGKFEVEYDANGYAKRAVKVK
nr:MAG TPA: hypothetical protein [Caudoviricetes sp.]